MVESTEYRSSGAAAATSTTATTATATTTTSIAYRTASCSIPEFDRWLGLWTSTETVADTVGD